MEKLYKYLEKNGIPYTSRAAVCNYFYNVPEIRHEVAQITAEPKKAAGIMEKIRRYARRYGYIIIRAYGDQYAHTFIVGRADEYEMRKTYGDFQKKSADAAADAIHLRRQGFYSDMNDADFNDYIKGIMEFYGGEYLAA